MYVSDSGHRLLSSLQESVLEINVISVHIRAHVSDSGHRLLSSGRENTPESMRLVVLGCQLSALIMNVVLVQYVCV